MLMNLFFISLYLKTYIQNLVEIGSRVSEKKQVIIFIYKNTLGQGQDMTLNLNTRIPKFTRLVVCISEAAIGSEKSIVVTFFYRKPNQI